MRPAALTVLAAMFLRTLFFADATASGPAAETIIRFVPRAALSPAPPVFGDAATSPTAWITMVRTSPSVILYQTLSVPVVYARSAAVLCEPLFNAHRRARNALPARFSRRQKFFLLCCTLPCDKGVALHLCVGQNFCSVFVKDRPWAAKFARGPAKIDYKKENVI